jgi:hypothetical protein
MEETKNEKCIYSVKGCKCTGCEDCKANAERERKLHRLSDDTSADEY